jgi:hypothetical protein
MEGKYERSEESETLNPAFWNILNVASCRLPLGSPSFNTVFFMFTVLG